MTVPIVYYIVNRRRKAVTEVTGINSIGPKYQNTNRAFTLPAFRTR
jgi:hypothetical protein